MGGFPACPPFCAFFGTSAASPHTAGVAALLLQRDPSMTPLAVQVALHKGAVDIGPVGFDDASGFGRLDAVTTINLPEPGATVQLFAGLAGLFAIASWRARRRSTPCSAETSSHASW